VVRAPGLCVLMFTGLAASSAAGAAGFASSVPVGSDARVSSAACTAPPAPGGKKRTVPEGHATPSSYAPQPRAPHRAYGAPIQRPILSKRKRHKHHAESPQAR
jgi:hypothetical protein